MLKDAESIKIRNAQGFIDSGNPLPVSNITGALTITNAIDETSYDLNASAFSKITDISNDYILDNIELNFSTTEEKTITVTTSDGTIVWEDTNTEQSVHLSNMNIGFNANENVTVAVTQFSSAGTMDCIVKVRQGATSLTGNPVLGAGSEIVGKVGLVNDDNEDIGVHYPLSTDGDSVYVKDIWVNESNIGDFSGSIDDLFNNLHSFIVDNTSNNPKELLIHFNRTIVSNVVGLGSYGGNFSNTKIEIYTSGHIATTVIDESSSNTKYTSRTFQLPITAGINAIKFSFHTSDTITLSNCVVLKTIGVVARLQATKPDNTITDINATTGGNLKFSLEEYDDTFLTNPLPVADFRLNVAKGLVPGHSTVHKYGRGANIDTADGFVDLWDGAEYNAALKTYTYSTTADIDRISSSDNGDTQDIVIEGLDSNWDFVSQTITLTGQTAVSLTTSLVRVFRMYNIGATDFAGYIFCFVNVATTSGVPNTITNTRAMINNGNNQTLMALYTIPNGKTGYVEHWYGVLSANKTSKCNLKMQARPFGSVFRLKHTSTLDSTGNSHIQHDFEYPQKLPAKTDIRMSGDSDVNDNAVSAGFELLLVDD